MSSAAHPGWQGKPLLEGQRLLEGAVPQGGTHSTPHPSLQAGDTPHCVF